MASTVTVEAHRRRFSVKATPMMPLSAVVADVLGQLKLTEAGVRPQDCRLLLKGKPLTDLSTPVRFANIGRDKLELHTGREPVLGVQAVAQPAPPVPETGAAAAPPPPQQQQQQQGRPSAAAQPQAGSSSAAPAELPAAATSQPTGATTAAADTDQPATASAARSAAAAAPSIAGPSGTTVEAAADAPEAAAAAAAEESHPSVAVFGQRVYVFTRQAEQAAESAAADSSGGGAAAAGAELDDSFFDFTEMDLRRAMAGQAAQRARQEGGHLMTAQMREREERRRAEAYGSVPIRLYLPEPSGLCLQTFLPATAPLSSLLDLAKRALLPAAAAAGPYLFTTPPRTVLKDLSISLYASKMVPAAKVHLGLDASKAPAGADQQQLISPEVLALVEAPPERAAVMHANQRQAAAASGVGASAGPSGSGARTGGSSSGGAAQPQKGVPKWMKLSGK